jgi:assimilatory nitrate reductase catalytic subunit
VLDAHELATHALDLPPRWPGLQQAAMRLRLSHRDPLHLPLLRRGLRRDHRVDGAQITGVRGDPDHPANFGRLCTKGSTLHLTASAAAPARRAAAADARPQRGEAPQPVGWDAALDAMAERFATSSCSEHGPRRRGLLRVRPAADRGLLRLQQAGQGPDRHQQHRHQLAPVHEQRGGRLQGHAGRRRAARPATTTSTMRAPSSSPAPTPAWAHPVLFAGWKTPARQPGPEAGSSSTRAAPRPRPADLHLQILPGTDVALFHGLLHLMLWEGLDRQPPSSPRTPRLRRAARPRARLHARAAAAALRPARGRHRAGGALVRAGAHAQSLYCQGLNQSSSGTAKNTALINLHLATGQIGKPGAGPFSLTGQPNAMGGREVGGLANLLSRTATWPTRAPRRGGRAVGRADVPAGPARPRWRCSRPPPTARSRRCGSPAPTRPSRCPTRPWCARAGARRTRGAAGGLRHHRHRAHADLLLPATTWGEKDGTVTNSERRISRVRAAVPPPGQARADWAIAVDVARRLERGCARAAAHAVSYDSPRTVWNEHRATTRGRDLDITGLSYPDAGDPRPAAVALPEGRHHGTRPPVRGRRFRHPDGRARFVDTPALPLAEPRDARYPFS